MVNFKKLIQSSTSVDIKNLKALFEDLERQASHLELRVVQEEALSMLSNSRDAKDIILKINTGSGKTLVGLLYLLSFMKECQEPVVYLCPTKQLCEQVHAEAKKFGIKTVLYKGGETHPQLEATQAKAIIICTYDKLFNARTTFDTTKLRPCAFVLDDAHAGIEEIRDSFTLKIYKGEELYKNLINIFDNSCKSYNSIRWANILNEPESIMEIPYWIWKNILTAVENELIKHTHEKIFTLPYLQDILRWCRCLISSTTIEILPEILPVEKSEAFFNAKHRLFMSATLADDSILVRELGCDISAAQKPVIPSSDKGLGERMILAPSLIDASLDRDWIMTLCSQVSNKIRIIVLSPNERTAREWETFGAKVFMGDEVAPAVERLKNYDDLNFVVFVQRYDGIDLPDNACRILILDGMPFGEGIADRYDSRLSEMPFGTRNRLIYRIEQGMGRAVRSHADYAVIILAGLELAQFIATPKILKAMNPDTRAQLQLATEDLRQLALDEVESAAKPEDVVKDLIRQCLNRDDGWKQFYNQKIRAESKIDPQTSNLAPLIIANCEREAFKCALANDPYGAISILQNTIDKHIQDDDKSKGWYLQKIANYRFEFDPGKAIETQRSAYSHNKSTFLPPMAAKRPEKSETNNIQNNILDYYKKFKNPNDILATIQGLKTRLSFSNSTDEFEQAFCELASFLGASGSRPEKETGVGPDDLWIWPDLSLVIEAKTENQKSLHKKDSGQLLNSLQWFKEKYPKLNQPLPVIITNVSLIDDDAYFPDNTRIINQEKINFLLDGLENFYYTLISDSSLMSNRESTYRSLESYSLTPQRIISKFTFLLKK